MPGQRLANTASGGAYSGVCSAADGPLGPYMVATASASRAEPKSISRRCGAPAGADPPARSPVRDSGRFKHHLAKEHQLLPSSCTR